MLSASEAALPVDIAVMAAAVSDWRVESEAGQKLKKDGGLPPLLRLVENPDILATIAARRNDRPSLVVGFAAETEKIIANAVEKRRRKGCDWILANDVSPATGTFGGDSNTIHLVDGGGVEDSPVMTKAEVAARLAERIAVAYRRGGIIRPDRRRDGPCCFGGRPEQGGFGSTGIAPACRNAPREPK